MSEIYKIEMSIYKALGFHSTSFIAVVSEIDGDHYAEIIFHRDTPHEKRIVFKCKIIQDDPNIMVADGLYEDINAESLFTFMFFKLAVIE